VYQTTSDGALTLNGTLTLNAAGVASAVFIFQTGSSLSTGTSSNVVLTDGASPCNVFWQVGSSATLDGPHLRRNRHGVDLDHPGLWGHGGRTGIGPNR
jgi:hypothetical protein